MNSGLCEADDKTLASSEFFLVFFQGYLSNLQWTRQVHSLTVWRDAEMTGEDE